METNFMYKERELSSLLKKYSEEIKAIFPRCSSLKYLLEDNDTSLYISNDYMQFQLVFFHNDGDFLVSKYLHINKDARGKGIAQILQKLKLEIARLFEISGLICTVNKNNKAQIHILEKFGWKKVGSGNSTFLYFKDVKEEE